MTDSETSGLRGAARERLDSLIALLTEHATHGTDLDGGRLRAIELLLKIHSASLDAPEDPELVVKGALTWSPPQA